MHHLRLSASGALAQLCDILQRLARHLPMPLLHVRCLLLWYGLEDGFPDIFEDRWDAELERRREGK